MLILPEISRFVAAQAQTGSFSHVLLWLAE
jgi:hypothetical protein